VVVGADVADAAGNWQITSNALADGLYRLSANAFRANGLTTGAVTLGPLLIDTVAPRVIDVTFVPATGRVFVSYQDSLAGLESGSVLNTSNYEVLRPFSNPQRALSVTRVTAGTPATPASPHRATVLVDGGRRIDHGRIVLAIASGGVADVAGN